MIIMKSESFKLIDEENAEAGKYLSLMWGRPEFRSYMKVLLDTSVAGKAREFSAGVLLALIDLSQEHYNEFRI
jgi:hypothetical protein